MKQCISYDQKEELSKIQGVKFCDWWYGRKYYRSHHKGIRDYQDPTNEKITIGQMIEFLNEHGDGHFPGQGWFNYVIKETQEQGDILIPYTADELCDALWEAVKEVLGE